MAVGTAMVGRPPRCRGWSCQPQGASRSSTGSHSDAMIDEDSPIGFLLANENVQGHYLLREPRLAPCG